MSKLIETLAEMPSSEVEDIVLLWVGNEVFKIAANDQPENKEANLYALTQLRFGPLVTSLSADGEAKAADLIDTCVKLVSTDDTEDDEADDSE